MDIKRKSSKKDQPNQPQPSLASGGMIDGSSYASNDSFVREDQSSLRHGFEYYDEQKVRQLISLFASLEKKSEIAKMIDDSHSLNGIVGGLSSENKHGFGDEKKRNMFMKIDKAIIKRVYRINHVLLQFNVVTPVIYHILMFIEFLQELHFVFFSVIYRNGFATMILQTLSIKPYLDRILSQTTSQDQANQVTEMLTRAQIGTVGDVIFRLDTPIQFWNPALYVLDQYDAGAKSFIIAYSCAIGFFFFFIIGLIFFANQIFIANKKEKMKDASKFTMKILSAIMLLMISLFQIPIYTLLLQGFTCDESKLHEFTLPQIKCNTTQHQLLIVLSSVTLFVYLMFLLLQIPLFSSIDFDSKLPWSRFGRKVMQVKVLYKLLLVSSFSFDKSGQSKPIVCLICFVLCLYVIYKRATDALFFNKNIHRASIVYEMFVGYHLLFVSIHLLTDQRQSVSTVFIFMVNAIVFLGLILFLQERSRFKIINRQYYVKSASASKCETYFFRIHELMESKKQTDFMFLHGMFETHMDECTNKSCECINLAENIDKILKYRNIKQKAQSQFEQNQQNQLYEKEQSISPNNQGTRRNFQPTLQIIRRASVSQKILANGQLERIDSLFKNDDSTIQEQATNTPINGSSDHMLINNVLPSINNKDYSMLSTTHNGGAILSQDVKFEEVFMHLIEDEFGPLEEEYDASNKSYISRENGGLQNFSNSKLQKHFFKFFAILVGSVLARFPNNICLRILYSYIQKSKLNNQFKAIFEMISCERFELSILEKFIVFKRKQEIEMELIQQHQRTMAKTGSFDITIYFNYERAFLRFQLNEALATHAALSFWRELLQKQFNATSLQQKGLEISRSFARIQNAAKEISKIYPDDIKFHYRYGMFLIKIINNDYDGVESFRKAQNVYQNMIQKDSDRKGANLQYQIGENQASAMIVISATRDNYGRVIHANDEVECLLGYKRKDLIGKNVSIVIPKIIGEIHDLFIKKYLETAENRAIDLLRQSFALHQNGNMQPVKLYIKIYPEINGKIIFVGFVQNCPQYSIMEAPKSDYEKLDQHYIMTTSRGHIVNVTQSLIYELGLSNKFFKYDEDQMLAMVKLESICSQISEPEIENQMEFEGGAILKFDTRKLLEIVELESLSHEEMNEVKLGLGVRSTYVQLSRYNIDVANKNVNIYRIIFPRNDKDLVGSQGGPNEIMNMTTIGRIKEIRSKELSAHGSNSFHLESNGSKGSMLQNSIDQMDINSMSSTASSVSSSFSSIIRDFKRTLSERETPKTLVILNRVIICILLTTIMLSTIDFLRVQFEINDIATENVHNLNSEKRVFGIVQLSSNTRTYINIANSLAKNLFSLESLNKIINRHEFLGALIAEQGDQLQEVHEYMAQQRTVDDSGTDDLQSAFEYENIDLYRLDEQNYVTKYQQPYRVAFFQFLNFIQQLNQTKFPDGLYLPDSLIYLSPSENRTLHIGNTTYSQKSVYFLITNGLRSLRTRSIDARAFQQENSSDGLSSTPFLLILLAGLIVICVSISLVYYQIWQIEHIQSDILSLYAHINVMHIKEVYRKSVEYMKLIQNGSFIAQISPLQKVRSTMNTSTIYPNIYLKKPIEVQKSSDQILRTKIPDQNFSQKQHASKDCDIISEEEKELYDQERAIFSQKRFMNGTLQYTNGNATQVEQVGQCIERMYSMMIKRSFQEIKALNELTEWEKIQREKEIRNTPGFYSKKQTQSQIPRDDGDENYDKDLLHQKSQQGKQLKKKSNKFFKDSRKSEKLQKRISGEIKKKFGIKKKKVTVEDIDDIQLQNESKNITDLTADEITQSSNAHNDQKASERSSKNDISTSQRFISQLGDDQQSAESLQEQRKRQFKSTFKSNNQSKKIGTFLMGLIVTSYFILVYFYHGNFKSQLQEFSRSIPIFLDRFRYLMLSYSFMRERIILNNTMSSFEYDDEFGYNLDNKYHEYSMINERRLLNLKNNHISILDEMIDFLKDCDSENFCQLVIGNSLDDADDSIDVLQILEEEDENADVTANSKILDYECLIQTVFKACKAAYKGDLDTLMKLNADNLVDFDIGDYDYRRPIYFAVAANQTSVVQYLINQGANLNVKDRWDATPLNYAYQGSEIEKILLRNGARRGIEQNLTELTKDSIFDLNANYARMHYATLYGDLETIKDLYQLGVTIDKSDVDGRRPIHLAASEGYADIIKYFIAKGADLNAKDRHGYTAQYDSLRANQMIVHNLLDSIISNMIIKSQCKLFSHGIFEQGIGQAIGSFHKKFSDIQIKINYTKSYEQLLAMLGGHRFQKQQSESDWEASQTDETNVKIMSDYFQSQELYISRIIQLTQDKIVETFTRCTGNYWSESQIIFLAYIIAQALILFALRPKMIMKMRDEIFESRGILNLIPNHFFEQNKPLVESIMKKLKN